MDTPLTRKEMLDNMVARAREDEIAEADIDYFIKVCAEQSDEEFHNTVFVFWNARV